MNARERLERICGPQTPPELIAELDNYRAEVLAEAKVEVVAWLVKKAAEGNDPIESLASKADRGAIRIFLGTGHYRDAMDAHRAEVRTEDARLIEDAACDADWTRTPDFCAGLRAGAELLLANTEKATAAAATVTPTATNRRARLLHEMALGGRWKSGDVVAWYQRTGLTDLGVATARRDLATLRDSGAITQHDAKGVRFYTLPTAKGGAR